MSNHSKESKITNFFDYHLTIEIEQPAATTQCIRDCYAACDLASPSWLASHLSKGLKSKPRRFIKTRYGYRLEGKRREAIAKLLGDGRLAVQTSAALNRLQAHVAAGPK